MLLLFNCLNCYMVELKVLSVRYNLFAALASLMNSIAIGIKFNGLNYDEWIEYVKYHAGTTCIDTALVMENEPTEPIVSSTEAKKDLWEAWERSNRLLLSFLKLSIADNVKPSMPRITNVMEFSSYD